jgi:hypothetical protein
MQLLDPRLQLQYVRSESCGADELVGLKMLRVEDNNKCAHEMRDEANFVFHSENHSCQSSRSSLMLISD